MEIQEVETRIANSINGLWIAKREDGYYWTVANENTDLRDIASYESISEQLYTLLLNFKFSNKPLKSYYGIVTVEEAIDIICKRSKENDKMKMWYDEVFKNGIMNADDLHQFMDMGVPIIDLFAELNYVKKDTARICIKAGYLTASDLEQILINYAQSKA